ILPNQKGTIKLVFKTIGKSGNVASSVYIYSNSFYKEDQAFLRGIVTKVKEESIASPAKILDLPEIDEQK
ncbi:MAG: hypothetical protein AB8B69_09170, partial [Chitinophagales bacterium]